jgi:anti-anti-sigma regulatory factor
MNYTIEKNDQYSLIKTDLTEFNKETCHKLREKVLHEVASSSKYVIVNIADVKECNADGTRELIQLGIDLQDNDGLLILTHADDQFTRLFSKADITFIPHRCGSSGFCVYGPAGKAIPLAWVMTKRFYEY